MRVRDHGKLSDRQQSETPLDISWKRLQHEQWFVTEPKLGKQGESWSDIAEQHVDYQA